MIVEHRKAYERLHEPRPHDAKFFNGYVREKCPRCEYDKIISRGSDGATGMIRYAKPLQ